MNFIATPVYQRNIIERYKMKSKWYLISSIIQVIIGLSAIISFFVLKQAGEDMARWVITLILAIAFEVMGIINIIDYKKKQ